MDPPAPAPEILSGVPSNAMRRRQFIRRRRPSRFRRRRYGRRVSTLQPKSIVRRFKTVKYFTLNPVAGDLYSQQLKLNSPFDPNGGAGSEQPLGWDQYTALYQRSAVVSWSVNIEAVSTDNTNPIKIGFTPMVSSTGLTEYQHYMELPATVSTVLTPDIDKTLLRSRGGVKKWFLPRGGRMLADDTLSHGTSAGDPSRILYGHVWAEAMDGAADPATVHFTVTMWQTCVLYVPAIPARS